MSCRTPWSLLWLAALCAAPWNAPAQPPDDAACQVWRRELSFAQSVRRHDAAAFAAHIADDAVFDANTATPTRGLAAIRRHWASFIEGKARRLSWYPEQVVTSGGNTLAYSSGRYLYENRAPNANPRYTIGRFATTWVRGSDGIWRVAFDGGDAGHRATAAEIAAFQAGRRDSCPRAAAKR